MMFYIDPGTGSMLFTVLIGLLGAGLYALRDVFVKIRFFLSGGVAEKDDGMHPSFVIFSDDKRYWNLFKPICDEFEKRETEVVYMTLSPEDPALSSTDYSHVKCEFIGEGNKGFAKLNTLKADIVLSTTPSLDVFYWKRSKNVKYYVHIGHAATDLTLYHMFGIDYYDAILVSGDYQRDQVRALEKVRGLPEKEIVKVGITFLDVMKERLDKNGTHVKKGSDTPTVLLAPSWGTSGILTRYGETMIDALIATGYKIIIRPHPQSFTSEVELMERLMEKYPEGENLKWNRDNDNFDVLNGSDIMISDFSGVIFDYCLVFDKPVIYTDVEFDNSPYDACWLSEAPWVIKSLPKIGLELTRDNFTNIKELIDRCLKDTTFQEGRDKARSESWAYMGEGAKRTVDYLIEKHKAINKQKCH